MKYITLANGTKVKVDNDDYDMLSQWKWHISNGYASRHKNDGTGSKLYLHRIVSNTPDDLHTDHINGDKLDNRKKNLREVTASQNHMNRRKDTRKNLTSQMKGSQYHRASGLWRSRIKVKDKQISLGYFKTEIEAHTAYVKAARKYFGVYRFVG